MRELNDIILKKKCKELENLVGETVRVSIDSNDIGLQFTKSGEGKRNVKRKLNKGLNGYYYITWNRTRLFVGLEFFKYSNGDIEPTIGLTAYSQVSQSKNNNGEWIYSTDIKKTFEY